MKNKVLVGDFVILLRAIHQFRHQQQNFPLFAQLSNYKKPLKSLRKYHVLIDYFV